MSTDPFDYHAAEDAREQEAKEYGRTEETMRDSKVPTPNSVEELGQYVDSMTRGPHTYGTCIYAMSLAACAAYNYVASRLGVTGFQASCADLDIVKRNRGINGSFILLKAEDLLYPQYDLRQRLDEWIGQQRAWLRDEAKNLLANNSYPPAPSVKAHWESLAREE